MTELSRRLTLAALLASPLAAPFLSRPAAAQSAAVASIEAFEAVLLEIMKNADRLGVRGRYQRLAPVIERVFNLPVMARIACGRPWNDFAPAQQQAVAGAFSEWTIANYAKSFDGYSGESFAMDGENSLANGDLMVRTHINRPNDTPVQINYLMRNFGGAFRVVDIYLTGTISELASRRAEFTNILRDGGPDRLVADLKRRTRDLLK